MKYGQLVKLTHSVKMDLPDAVRIIDLFKTKYTVGMRIIKQEWDHGWHADGFRDKNISFAVIPAGTLGIVAAIYMNSENTKIEVLIPDPVNKEFLHGIKVVLPSFEAYTEIITPEEKEYLHESVAKFICKKYNHLNPLQIVEKVAEVLQ